MPNWSQWSLNYQKQHKQVFKTSLFSEGRLYQWISDGLNCCTSHFRSTALIVWDVPRAVVKYKRMRWLWTWFEGLVFFWLTFNRIQIKGLVLSDKWLFDCKCPLNCQLQYKQISKTSLFSKGWQAVCILKCAVSIGQYTHTVCIIQCEVFIVQPTVCSTHLFPCE